VREITGTLVVLGSIAIGSAAADEVQLTAVATGFNNPIGIDHHPFSGKLILSVNFPSGVPYNFELVGPDGTHSPFSSISGLTDEVKIASVRESACQGGFAAGEVFTGTGVPGVIARIAPDGSSVQNPWVTLPGETGLLRGSLFQDRYCVFGGDLLVVTTDGNVWRVSSAGDAVRLASVGTHLEGLTTVPNDATRYGPWAGHLLAGAEDQARIYAVGPGGDVAFYELGVRPEDIDLIPANENFFGVDFGGRTIWGAGPDQFGDKVGDFLMTQEFPGILWHVRWNGSLFEASQVAQVTQWEHMTFSPAGVPPIPPATPCGAAAIVPPDDFVLTGHTWSAGVSVSGDEGLVLHDVTLGPRYMARQMSVPYFRLETSALPERRGVLTAFGDQSVLRSRLIQFSKHEPAPGAPEPASVEAVYAVDRIPAGSNSCLVVRQRYELEPERPRGGCEPSQFVPVVGPFVERLNCSVWKPLVDYTFYGDRGETLAMFNAPQRMHFPDQDKPRKFVSLFRDCDDNPLSPVCDRHPVTAEEASLVAIAAGKAGDWDNYHQAAHEIREPGFQVSPPPPTLGPGCAECIHIHWRWGKSVPDFEFKHGGTPIIPDGSDQSVELAVVAFHPGEERPEDFHSLVDLNPEPLLDDNPVLWYSATSHRPTDTFFMHGGFFQPVPEADLALSGSAPESVTPGSDLTLTFTVSNQGPSFATDVELGVHRAPGPGAAFAPELSSQGCEPFLSGARCRLGDMAPNTNQTVIVVFHVAARAPGDGFVMTARTAGSRHDPDGSNDQVTLQTTVVR
jgi:hypothetical protein